MRIKSIRALLGVAAACLILSFPSNSWSMQAPASPPAASKQASTGPSAAEIADAKAKGMVWANTSSKIYHKSDYPKYGMTKHGKFMTEADAVKAGYRAAKTSPVGHAKTTSTTPQG